MSHSAVGLILLVQYDKRIPLSLGVKIEGNRPGSRKSMCTGWESEKNLAYFKANFFKMDPLRVNQHTLCFISIFIKIYN